jgi:hypothetical protein
MPHLSRLLGTTLAGGALAVGCLTFAAPPAAADVCLPQIPPLPPICVPEIPGVPLPGFEPPVATSPAAITGTPKVGSELTATEPTWNDATATTTYQWQQAGVAITGATEPTYTVRPADVGKQVTVVATGTNTFLLAGESTSAPVTGVIGDPIEWETAPSITGVPAPGRTLTARPGTWPGEVEATFTYQWFRDRVPVSGAFAATYAVGAADAGRSLAVRVTATRPGYQPGVAAAGPRQVAKLATATRLALPKKVIRQGAKGLLKIMLTAAGPKPFGKVRVFDGRRLLQTYTVRSSDNGTRIVRLPQLRPGKHSLTARYLGNSTAKASRSEAVVLKVRRRAA